MDELAALDENWFGRARPRREFRLFNDFEVGMEIRHGLSRSVTETDNVLYNMLTLHYNRLYFDRSYAREQGESDVVVNPYFGFLLVFGITVEDLSEKGGGGKGGFLGVDNLEFRRDLRLGDTVSAISRVMAKRVSSSRPELGIVTWRTDGFADGQPLLSYTRSNMLLLDPSRIVEAGA